MNAGVTIEKETQTNTDKHGNQTTKEIKHYIFPKKAKQEQVEVVQADQKSSFDILIKKPESLVDAPPPPLHLSKNSIDKLWPTP